MLTLSYSPRAPLSQFVERLRLVSHGQCVRRECILQLALECGFCDQAHLANEFRKLSGLTPTDYQRKMRQQRDVLSGHVALS